MTKKIIIIATIVASLVIAYGFKYKIYTTLKFTKNIMLCPVTKFDNNNELKSQYYEDYVLGYVFRNSKQGFFVDVGVNEPEIHNATDIFYKKGWKGINIEPNPIFYNKLLELRPTNVNIKKAASNTTGTAFFYDVKDASGLSSLDPETYKKFGPEKVSTIEVEIDTLTNIFNQNNLGINEIDFVKIDVENKEKEVLEGLDLNKYRPKVLVVESASQINFYGFVSFEDYVIDNGYLFGMTDDLNRYYYRKESPEFQQPFEFINRCTRIDKIKRNVECLSKHKCSF